MLRQLARLTRPVPAAGPDAQAVAVYADVQARLVVAKESGFEGVACVDDAARLLDVLCDVWTRTQAPWASRWAHGILDFVLWMQEPDGRWLNFVQDWEGTKNRTGITSTTGENFWHARALLGVSHAWVTFADERAGAAVHRGLDHAVTKPAPPDVRALHLRTAHRLIVVAGIATLESAVRHWAHEIAECRRDGVLLNSPYETDTPHLWAHIQEGVLADAAVLLDEPALLGVAVESAERLLLPVVASGFDRNSSSPYDVASAIFSLDRLSIATEDARWVSAARDARAWFDGRNPAGAPVYDDGDGRVADGVDEGRVSGNSGAEANIEGAGALMDRVVTIAAQGDPFAVAGPG